jgi:hypothetical protein
MQNFRPSAREELSAFARYARRLPGFLRSPIEPSEGRRRIRAWIDRREQSFLDVLERGVYANPGSPYLPLLDAAGIGLGDARTLIAERGLEGALGALRDSGVYATLDEFKGHAPLERNGVSRQLGDGDFDNPLIAGHYWGATGGSRGTSRRVAVDLGRLEHEAAYQGPFREAFGLSGRPFGIWRVIPPSRAGLNNYLYQVKSGASVQRWFNPYRAPRDLDSLRFALFTAYTTRLGRRFGGELRGPEYCPTTEAARVARWLADCAERGSPAVLDAQSGLGIRACLAAQDHGLEIAGTFLRLGGEPFTDAKARVIEATGSRAVSHYAMAEVGRIGWACAEPAALDDVHLARDKVAMIQRDRRVASGDVSVDAFLLTAVVPTSSKVMINVEIGDYGVSTERECGCYLGELGLNVHLHRIRSFDKLTTDGNNFLGSDLYTLVDEVLPVRFGGAPTDYQLVEEEVDGLPRVSIVVGPRVGEVADAEVLSAVVEFMREVPRNRLMADFWAQGETLRVVRREPHLTSAGKILPLHLVPPA